MSPDEQIAAISANQHGVFTHRQAIRTGLTPGAIRRRRESGRWLSPYRGVYVIAGSPVTREQEIISAVFAYRGLAGTSHLDAAMLLGVADVSRGPVHVVLPHGHHRGGRRGVVVHQADLSRSDLRPIRAIPTTCPNRTLVDLATILTPERLEACVDEAILSGLTTAIRGRQYVLDRGLVHKRGAGVLMEILHDRIGGALQKELERMFVRKIKRSALPMPARQFRVGRRRIDFAYPGEMIAIELDGRKPHSSGAVFRDDRRRQNDLVLAGWYPVRFTWVDVEHDWDAVEGVLATLRLQRRRVG